MRRIVLLVALVSAGAASAQVEECSGRSANLAPDRVIALDPKAKDRIEGRRGELKASSETAVWALDVKAATGVRIDVEGSEFDPAVELCGEEGGRLVKVDENLDGPRSLNPQLDRFLEPGRWLVVVKSEALAGPFTLLVRQTDEKPLAEAPSQPIRAGETRRGTIKPEPDMSITLKDRWRLPVEAGRSYLVTARSDAFDTILWVRDPALTSRAAPLAQDDDGWDRLNSALSFTAPKAGDVIIEIGDNNGNGGTYELAVRALEPPPANPPPLTDVTITLSMADARAPVAEGLPVVYRLFTVSGNAGERVRVEAAGTPTPLLAVLAETPLGLLPLISRGGANGRQRSESNPDLAMTFARPGAVVLLVGAPVMPNVPVQVRLEVVRSRE